MLPPRQTTRNNRGLAIAGRDRRDPGGPRVAGYTSDVTFRRRPYQAAAILLAIGLLTACVGQKELEQENERLRERVLELETQLQHETRQNTTLRARLQRTEAIAPGVEQEVQANTPYVAEITIDRWSHARDTDDDGRPDELLVYLEPVDGWGRFTQIVGTLSVHAALLPADADAETIGRVQLDPATLRRAYRSSFTGTHYTVTVPITEAAGFEATECIVHAEFVDGHTGVRYVAERRIDLPMP